jgi:hypothetical protein
MAAVWVVRESFTSASLAMVSTPRVSTVRRMAARKPTTTMAGG